MRIKQELFERDSNVEFAKDIVARIDASAGIIHVRANEIPRALLNCRRIALREGSEYYEWDIARGITQFDSQTFDQHLKEPSPEFPNCNQLPSALMTLLQQKLSSFMAKENFVYICFNDPTEYLNIPAVIMYLRFAADMLPKTNVRFIIVTPDVPPPRYLSDLVTTVRLHPPGFQELMDGARTMFKDSEEEVTVTGVDDEEAMKALCFAGVGMSMNSFLDTVSLAMSTYHDAEEVPVDELVAGVSRGKTEIINRTDVLELYQPEDIETIGGMENLKEWIEHRKNCYSDEAAEFGIEPPKGIVFVGPPGTGKSKAGKAISSVLRVPLVRLDFGRVFNALVGKSEERMREALKMCEELAPIVLFCDEIDKGLGGIGSGGDSGTSQRVLASFLTWLNDNTAPVFTMVTANNITHLPPELMRRGRFDAIFATGLPTDEERLAILRIHMSLRGWDPDEFKSTDMNRLVTKSRGYVGAEIESAVKDGLVLAFNRGEDFDPRHVEEALDVMVPLSQSYAEQILAMTVWAKANATPASKRYDDVENSEKVTKLQGRRIRKKEE